MRPAVRSHVVLDNDWSGDPDGLVALAHHLLSPGNAVLAVTSTFLHPMFGSPQSRAADGARLAGELIERINGPWPQIHAGAESPYTPGMRSPAAEAIVDLAGRSPTPIAIACGGPLTNIALALDLAPELVDRMELIWVGGAIDDAEAEYNRDTDPAAAERVFAVPGLAITQFPVEVYRECIVTLAMLESDLSNGGDVGRWLWDQFTGLHLPQFIEIGETWVLGDSLPVLATALDDTTCSFESAPQRPNLRICTGFDPHLLIADFRAKLRRCCSAAP